MTKSLPFTASAHCHIDRDKEQQCLVVAGGIFQVCSPRVDITPHCSICKELCWLQVGQTWSKHPSVGFIAATAATTAQFHPGYVVSLIPHAALGPSLSAGWKLTQKWADWCLGQWLTLQTAPKRLHFEPTHIYNSCFTFSLCSEHWKSTVSMHCFLEIMIDNDLCLICKLPMIT